MDPEGRALDASDDPAEPAEYNGAALLGLALLRWNYRASVARLAADAATNRLGRGVRDAQTRRHYEGRIKRLEAQRARLREAVGKCRRNGGDEEALAEGDQLVRETDEKLAKYRATYVRPNPRPDDLRLRGDVHVRVPPRRLGTRRLGCRRPRAVGRSSSRGGDSGDSSDDPEPAGPGDPVGDTSRSLDQLARRPLQPKRDLLRQLAERKRALDEVVKRWRQ